MSYILQCKGFIINNKITRIDKYDLDSNYSKRLVLPSREPVLVIRESRIGNYLTIIKNENMAYL